VAKAFGYATTSKEELTEFLEQSTGPEREELEAKAAGIENPWHEAWCAAAARASPASRLRLLHVCCCLQNQQYCHMAGGGASLVPMAVQQLALPSLAPPFYNSRLDAPFGTEDNPVVVPSECAERIVGVNDPDDDSLVCVARRSRPWGRGGCHACSPLCCPFLGTPL
jgi:hypothetical protein